MSFDGKWNIVMKTPMGDREAEITLSQEGDNITGEAVADGNATPLKNGRVEDGHAKFEMDLTSPMPITLEFDLETEGDALSGNVKLGMFGNSAVTGSRA